MAAGNYERSTAQRTESTPVSALQRPISESGLPSVRKHRSRYRRVREDLRTIRGISFLIRAVTWPRVCRAHVFQLVGDGLLSVPASVYTIAEEVSSELI